MSKTQPSESDVFCLELKGKCIHSDSMKSGTVFMTCLLDSMKSGPVEYEERFKKQFNALANFPLFRYCVMLDLA